ncbi:MAG TPA: DUF6263 family protein [Verrucomicrobiae bacterium]|nr:DUF6263 family protein [Verrucomicrobiae bacterium]
MNDDLTLLREFAENNSESAFAEIVSRHVNLVYSVALRQVRDAHLAEEITQAVFIILARKANALGDKTILSGWLCRTARYASANALTIQRRRQKREQEAFMQSQMEQNDSPRENKALAEMWNQISPFLDDALKKLNGKDHDALALRFFENKSFAEVGAALGASEDAAKMRVNRALEKLRKIFARRGVSSTAAIIAGTISANSVQAAPIGLAKTISAVAITKGAVASASTLTLIKGALKIMAWTKMKIAVVVGAGVLLAAGGGTVVYEMNQHSQKERAASSVMNDPANIKINWVVGKKYTMRMELDQSTETSNQGQPVKSDVNVAQDFDISALKELPDDGRQLELKITDESLAVLQNGSKILSFDSTQNSADPNSPAALLGLTIGVPFQYYIDANGEVQKVEGMEALMKRVAAAKPQQQVLFRQLFGEGTLKQYVSLGEWLPNRLVKIGESWSVKKDINSPQVGILTLNMKFTFKNWEQHADRQCAHVEMTGSVSTKSVSTASGAAIQIEKGKIAGEFWFDPDLGMLVESDNNQSIAMKVTTQAQTTALQMNEKSRWTLVDTQ